MSSTLSLMIVEDSQEDLYTIKRILENHNFKYPTIFLESGEATLAYFDDLRNGYGKLVPTLILLDLNLPGTDGREVLETLRTDPATRAIPVVVTTTSSNPRDISFCYEQNIQGYFVKPVDFDRLQFALTNILNYWFNVITLPFDQVSYERPTS